MNILDKLIYHFHRPKLNLIKTLIFNFKTMPLAVAIKLPVFLYGKVDFYFLKAEVFFENCEVKRGMIKMGSNIEYLSTVKGASLFVLYPNSRIIFEGPSRFSSDFLIRTGKDAVLRIGEDTFFGSGMKLICIRDIAVGKATQFAFNCQILDSDFHYIHNLNTNEIAPREKAVHIGSYNWFGNSTTVGKGTVTETYTIVASNSLLNKNYKETYQSFDVLAGQPAKKVSSGFKRVFDLEKEEDLVAFFKNNYIDKGTNVYENERLREIISENK